MQDWASPRDTDGRWALITLAHDLFAIFFPERLLCMQVTVFYMKHLARPRELFHFDGYTHGERVGSC